MAIANVGSVSATVVPDARGFKEKLAAELGNLSIHVDLDTTAATAKIRALTAELDVLGHRNPDIGVDVHTLGAEANIAGLAGEIAGLEGELAVLGAEMEGVGQIGSEAFGEVDAAASPLEGTLAGVTGALAILAGGFVAFLLVAALPVAAVFTLISGGLLAVASAATLGIGAFLAVAISATGGLDPKHNTLFAQLAKDFKDLTASVKPQVLAVVSQFVKVLEIAFPLIAPFLRIVLPGLSQVATNLGAALGSPSARIFFDQLAFLAGSSLPLVAQFIGEMASGIGSLILAFGPAGLDILKGLTNFFSGAGSFGQSPGFQKFLQYAKDNLPAVKKLFGDLLGLIGSIITDLAPLGPAAIAVLDTIIVWLRDTFLPWFIGTLLPGMLSVISSLIRFFRILGDFILGVLSGITEAAAIAFGWVPGLGPKLKDAAAGVAQFKVDFDRDMSTAQAVADTFAGTLQNIADNSNIDVGVNIHVSEHGGSTDAVNWLKFLGLNPSTSGVGPGGHGGSVKVKVKRKAGGGLIDGPGSSTSDSVPILASNGEYMQQQSAVARYGLPFMDAVNAGTYNPHASVSAVINTLDPQVAEAMLLSAMRKRDLLYPVG